MLTNMSKSRSLGIYLCCALALLLYHVDGQSCPNGTFCDPPPSLTLDASSPVIVSASSFCNGSFFLGDKTLPCDPPDKQLSNLRDKIVNFLNITEGVYGTYWISALTMNTIDKTYREESIIVNFTNTFLITGIKIIFSTPDNLANDMRPRSMEIQGFVGSTWQTWKYLDVDCSGKDPCETRNSSSGGGGEYSMVGFIPSEDETLQMLYMASAVQFKFKMPAITNNENLSYYTVSDIDIQYRCACYGHASQCNGATGVCQCQHNTAGNNCEICLPLYNNVSWQMATPTSAFQCQVCNCNNRGTSCEYNDIDMSASCTGCLHGTSGKYCENCAPGYYFNPVGNASATSANNCTGFDGSTTKSYNCLDVCIPCNCSTVGTYNNGASCDSNGQCQCKSRVTGRICDTCADGSYNLSPLAPEGCSGCDCEVMGIVTCDKTNGTCTCKNNTSGVRCDTCKPGYFNLSLSNPDGCSFCDCDVGASASRACDGSGSCQCKSFTTSRTCGSTVGGYFGPRLDFYTFDAEYFANVAGGNIVERVGGGSEGSTFTGRGFLSVIPPANLNFTARVMSSALYQVVLRYESSLTTDVTVVVTPSAINSGSTGPLAISINDPVCSNSTTDATLSGPITIKDSSGFTRLVGSICLATGANYDVKLSVPPARSGGLGSSILLDSVVFFPSIENLTSYVAGNDSTKARMRQCFEADMVVSSANRTALGCPAIDYSLMIDLGGQAYACNCDAVGSYNQSCSSVGGQCPCKPNVFLRNCSQCSVNSYRFSLEGCLACACHPNASVTLKCNENGTCQCKANVTGEKCDRCIDKHFGLTTGAGCQPCQCSGSYVVNDSCLDNGQCFCKPGISGVKCTSCAPGYYGLTSLGCSSCNCNLQGSQASFCDPVSGTCACKTQVAGFFCDSCKPGYFGLGPYSSEGCMKCHCSGVSQNCTSAPDWYQAVSISKPSLGSSIPFEEPWTGVTQNGSSVPVNFGSTLVIPDMFWQITNTDGTETPLYFASPKRCSAETCFNGFKASSYAQWLNITLMFNQYPPSAPPGPLMTPFPSYPDGDVIIRGEGVNYFLTTSLNVSSAQPTTYRIMISESYWLKNGTSTHPSYDEMIQVLYNIQSILIRAKFSINNGSTTSLINITMGYGVNDPASDKVPLTNVEQCVCPPTYEGQFCESCSADYTKVNGKCVQCTCNNHKFPGTTCDPNTGKCNCTHNTQGDHCDKCLPGYYGDATTKLPGSCKPCMCPGNVNDPNALVHSPNKSCSISGLSFVCDCEKGYSGSRCDSCGYGYYGTPANMTVGGGMCQQCNCGDTVDCDGVTGECRNCSGNKMGVGCSQCKPKYFSLELVGPSTVCQACTCNETGSSSCDVNTGRCHCRTDIDPSTNCSSCSPGFFNFSSAGCSNCGCNVQGTVDGNANCSLTGQCTCKANFVGLKCDQCTDQKYGDDCNTNCSCLVDYTVNGNNSCTKGGQCQCLDGYGGHSCNTCSGNESFDGITTLPEGTHPNCTSCGPCFRSLAERASILNKNLSALQSQTLDLIQKNFAGKGVSEYGWRLEVVSSPLNASESNMKMLNVLRDNLTNTHFYDVPSRLTQHDSDLQNFRANWTNLTARNGYLDGVDQNSLETGDPIYPSISLPNLNITFNSVRNNQTIMFSSAETAYNSIVSLDKLVQNQQFAVDGLKARVEAVNSTMSRSDQSLANSLDSMARISIPDFQSKLDLDTRRMTDTGKLVDSLGSDFDTAQYFLGNSMSLHNISKTLLDASISQYSSWNAQLGSTGSFQNYSNLILKAAQDAASLASRYCNLTQSLNESMTTAITNLFTSKKQMETSNLTNNINTMNSILSTSIDQYSNNLGPVIQSINAASVQQDLVTSLSRYADNSSIAAQGLTGLIQDAVNKTQQTQVKMNELISNMNSSSILDSQTRNCLSSNTGQASVIVSNVDSIMRKANETKIAADLISQAISNATSLFDPVKKSFSNISSSFAASRGSLSLINDTLQAVQFNELRNSNNMVILNTNYTVRMSEYSTWLVSKTQVETCISDLWTSLNNLNRPIKLADLATQTQTQLNQINQLTSDITTLENEINALLDAINKFGPENATCREAI